MSTEQRLIRTMVHSFAEIIERQVLRFENQGAEYERKLAEHRAAFAATSADGKRHEGILDTYRSELDEIDAALNPAREESTALVAKRLVEERDALRAEVAALQERLRSSIARGDFAQMEVAALKSQNTKQHPVKVGEWVRRTVASGTEPVGTMIQVERSRTLRLEYVTRGARVVPWDHCEPCDPPATHDTEAGKAAAEAALKTEPVAEEIKAGDIIEVVSATHKLYTDTEDIGRRGIVTAIDGMRVSVGAVPGYELPIRGIVGKCDVRKVTT